MQYAIDKETFEPKFVREYVDSWSSWSAIPSGGGSITVVDNLNSTSATDALSANQGKVLNNSINVQRYSKDYSTNSTTLAGIQSDADTLAGNDVGIFDVGYLNGTAAAAIGISGASFVYMIKHSSIRACLIFVDILTGICSYNHKVETWSNTIFVPNDNYKTNFTMKIPSGWTISMNESYKKGGFVYATGLLTADTAVTSSSLDFGIVIPSGSRPSKPVNFAAFNHNTNEPMWGIINEEGRLCIYRTVATSLTKIDFTVMYPV
jgi:hypothetical protein